MGAADPRAGCGTHRRLTEAVGDRRMTVITQPDPGTCCDSPDARHVPAPVHQRHAPHSVGGRVSNSAWTDPASRVVAQRRSPPTRCPTDFTGRRQREETPDVTEMEPRKSPCIALDATAIGRGQTQPRARSVHPLRGGRSWPHVHQTMPSSRAMNRDVRNADFTCTIWSNSSGQSGHSVASVRRRPNGGNRSSGPRSAPYGAWSDIARRQRVEWFETRYQIRGCHVAGCN